MIIIIIIIKSKGLDFLSTWHPSLSIVLIFLSPKKEKEKKGKKKRRFKCSTIQGCVR